MPTVFSLKEGDFFISNAIKKTQKKPGKKSAVKQVTVA